MMTTRFGLRMLLVLMLLWIGMHVVASSARAKRPQTLRTPYIEILHDSWEGKPWRWPVELAELGTQGVPYTYYHSGHVEGLAVKAKGQAFQVESWRSFEALMRASDAETADRVFREGLHAVELMLEVPAQKGTGYNLLVRVGSLHRDRFVLAGEAVRVHLEPDRETRVRQLSQVYTLVLRTR